GGSGWAFGPGLGADDDRRGRWGGPPQAPKPLPPMALASRFGLNLSQLAEGSDPRRRKGGSTLAKSVIQQIGPNGARWAQPKTACASLEGGKLPYGWDEPVRSAAAAGAAARRLRDCASSASSAQNSEQKCWPAEVRQNST